MLSSNLILTTTLILLSSLTKPTLAAPKYPNQGWQSAYPPPFKIPTPKPEWTGCLKDTSSIPDIPQASFKPGGYPVYPSTVDTTTICSWSTNGCYRSSDVHTTNPGSIVVSFDDGPQPISDKLYSFLAKNKVKASHYMIGSNILTSPQQLIDAYTQNQHIAVHTWSHTFLTTLSNQQIVAEIGWTIQLIYDLTGLIPNSMRAPDGDADDRVRAVIDKCFNHMKMIWWASESNDWRLINGPQGDGSGTNLTTVIGNLTLEISNTNPATTGIFSLHHEISEAQIDSFTSTFPAAILKGFKPLNIPQLTSTDYYFNSQDGSNPQPIADQFNGDPVLWILKKADPNYVPPTTLPPSSSGTSTSGSSSSTNSSASSNTLSNRSSSQSIDSSSPSSRTSSARISSSTTTNPSDIASATATTTSGSCKRIISIGGSTLFAFLLIAVI